MASASQWSLPACNQRDFAPVCLSEIVRCWPNSSLLPILMDERQKNAFFFLKKALQLLQLLRWCDILSSKHFFWRKTARRTPKYCDIPWLAISHQKCLIQPSWNTNNTSCSISPRTDKTSKCFPGSSRRQSNADSPIIIAEKSKQKTAKRERPSLRDLCSEIPVLHSEIKKAIHTLFDEVTPPALLRTTFACNKVDRNSRNEKNEKNVVKSQASHSFWDR